MPEISRQVVLSDVQTWLPEASILNTGQLMALMESVISAVGDDESNRSEIVCKVLLACGKANKTLTSSSNGLKREKSYMYEKEWWDQDLASHWDKFIEGLPDLCPYLPGGGYSFPSPSAFGVYISQSPKVTPYD